MGFMDFLLNMFPHRWLKRDAPGTLRLFKGLGAVLDLYYSKVRQVEQEADVRTAVYSLPERETEYGLNIDPSLPLEARRNRLIVRMREEGGPTNKKAFESALTMMLGVPTKVITHPTEQSVIYEYEETGKLVNVAAADEYIRRNKRAHIGHTFGSKTKGGTILLKAKAYQHSVDFPICGLEVPTTASVSGQIVSQGLSVSGTEYHHRVDAPITGFEVPMGEGE